MAGRILGPWNPARKATGAADVGAQLLFFENGTTTPTSLYTGYDGTNLTSPVPSATADANGLFPTLWIADDTRIRVRWLDGTGSQVLQVDNVGSSDPDGNANFSRNLGTDGQFQVRGEGGVVQVEAGPASPFVSGGDLRIGGWAGTALDSFELEAGNATMSGDYTFSGDVNFTGEPTFNGADVGVVLIEHGTATSVASVDIPLSPLYAILEVRVIAIGGSNPMAQLSSDGGTSFVTTTNYDSQRVVFGGSYSKTTTISGTGGTMITGGSAGSLLMRSAALDRRSWAGWVEASDRIPQPFSFSLATGGTYNYLRITWSGAVANIAWAVHGIRGL